MIIYDVDALSLLIPHINGLGYSATAKYYAIKNSEETEQYLNHPVLATDYCNALMQFWLSKIRRR